MAFPAKSPNAGGQKIINLEEDPDVQKALKEKEAAKEEVVETDISKMGCWGKIQNQ
jgi:hypothetical protein